MEISRGRTPPPPFSYFKGVGILGLVWVCGFVGLWVCGFVGLWLCGFVALWLCGFVALLLVLIACALWLDIFVHFLAGRAIPRSGETPIQMVHPQGRLTFSIPFWFGGPNGGSLGFLGQCQFWGALSNSLRDTRKKSAMLWGHVRMRQTQAHWGNKRILWIEATSCSQTYNKKSPSLDGHGKKLLPGLVVRSSTNEVR